MNAAIYAFTDKGKKLAEIIIERFSNDLGQDEEAAREYKTGKIRPLSIQFSGVNSGKLSADDFNNKELLIFVGASGIAVRMIAPFVKDKLTDPAVICISEDAGFVIPLLSGHVGGANELASLIAKRIGAIPVITTATDINNIIAVDELAKSNDFKIVNRDNIKKVSSGLLKGQAKNIVLSDDLVITSDESDIDDEVLGFLVRPIVIGMGLRRNKDFESLESFFLETLYELFIKEESEDKEKCLSDDSHSTNSGNDNEKCCDSKLNKVLNRVCAIASIDIKRDEPALNKLSEKYDIPLYFYSADELRKVEGDFEVSDFVERTVGVSDVSARAAKALGKRGKFLLDKKKQDGMTISVFEKLRRVTFKY